MTILTSDSLLIRIKIDKDDSDTIFKDIMKLKELGHLIECTILKTLSEK